LKQSQKNSIRKLIRLLYCHWLSQWGFLENIYKHKKVFYQEPAIISSVTKKYWSAKVTKTSIALDLEEGVFTWDDPKKIAQSLKHSAEVSTRKKAKTPYQSAMSMLNFYINRAGKNLPPDRRKILERAKVELRILCGKK